jgi:hypothetical protein
MRIKTESERERIRIRCGTAKERRFVGAPHRFASEQVAHVRAAAAVIA